MNIKIAIALLMISFLICLIIGLTLYLCGCDDILQPTCLRFYKLNAKIISHYTLKKICTECSLYVKISKYKQTCVKYRSHDCFESFAVAGFSVANNNKTCEIAVATESTQGEALEEALAVYDTNSYINLYVEKSNFKCSTERDVRGLALSGFYFLMVSAALLIILIALVCFCLLRKAKKLKLKNPMVVSSFDWERAGNKKEKVDIEIKKTLKTDKANKFVDNREKNDFNVEVILDSNRNSVGSRDLVLKETNNKNTKKFISPFEVKYLDEKDKRNLPTDLKHQNNNLNVDYNRSNYTNLSHSNELDYINKTPSRHVILNSTNDFDKLNIGKYTESSEIIKSSNNTEANIDKKT